MLRLTGLWESSSQNGGRVLSGRINGSCRLVILPNRYKAKDSDPDFIAYLVPAVRGEAPQGPAPSESEPVPF